MRMFFLIPFCFMKNNLRQTISILLSFILSIGMIVAVSCMMYSTHENKKQSIREQSGDYHYYLLGDSDIYSNIVKNRKNSAYNIRNIAKIEIKDSEDITEDFNIVLCFADDDCRKMINRDIIEGKYPEKANETALDRYTLRLLDVKDEIGTSFEINGKKYVLSGIINDLAEISGETREAYVCGSYPAVYDLEKIYLKFDEEKNLYDQVSAFSKDCEIELEALNSNGKLIECVVDGNIQRLINIVRTVLADDDANFITFLMKMKSEMHLTTGLVSFFLVVFSIFIVYSIFSVSVSKRMKEYGILQTIGVSRNMICSMLMTEMYLLLLTSCPAGIGLGILADKLFFRKGSDLFSGSISLIEKTHSGGENAAYISTENANNLFFIDKSSIVGFVILMALMIIGMCIIISSKINKTTVKDMINSEKSRHRKEKIYSFKHKSLLNTLTSRFMFAVPSKFIITVISMSLGCILILSINFIANNTRMNNIMVMHSQEGLSSDVKISVSKEESLYNGISSQQLEEIENSEDIASVSGFMYNLGEISIAKNLLHWKEYWPEIANDENWKQSPEILKRFNGIVTEDNDSYRIKTNIYGYDNNSLDKLENYVIDGEINVDSMKKQNGVILRTLIDAQNNHDGLDIDIGDKICIKTVKSPENNKELLRFESPEENYEEKEYTVIALVNSSLVTNTEYIGSRSIDVIMSNEQMKNNYNIDSYNILAVNKKDEKAVSNIQEVFKNDKNVNIYDNFLTIKAKNEEVKRAESLIYSIAVLLIIIAVFNIINIISHLLNSKRYSFAVLRAMGITRKNFYKMLWIQALKYTFATCITVTAAELFIQHITGNMLKHVYGYINQIQGVPPMIFILIFAVIAAIFIATVTITGKNILRFDIVNELKSN